MALKINQDILSKLEKMRERVQERLERLDSDEADRRDDNERIWLQSWVEEDLCDIIDAIKNEASDKRKTSLDAISNRTLVVMGIRGMNAHNERNRTNGHTRDWFTAHTVLDELRKVIKAHGEEPEGSPYRSRWFDAWSDKWVEQPTTGMITARLNKIARNNPEVLKAVELSGSRGGNISRGFQLISYSTSTTLR